MEIEFGQYFQEIQIDQNERFRYEDHIILLTFDENYVNQSINLIMSIARYHAEGVSYICLCPMLSEKSRREILSLKQGIRIKYLDYTPIIDTGKWPQCTMFRVFAPWLLEEEPVSKVLYMDSDILCTGSLNALFQLTPHYLAMCSELDANVKGRKYREYMPAHLYCNSGVAIFNLETIRKEYTFSVFKNALQEMKEKLQYVDQDFLNIWFCGKIDILNGAEFNFQPEEFIKSRYYQIALSKCKLVHFSWRKPWTYKCDVWNIKLYLKHSQYPPMIKTVKKALLRSCFHSVIRLNRPIQRWYYQMKALFKK